MADKGIRIGLELERASGPNQVVTTDALGKQYYVSAPVTSGHVLQYNGTTLVWASATATNSFTVEDGVNTFTIDGSAGGNQIRFRSPFETLKFDTSVAELVDVGLNLFDPLGNPANAADLIDGVNFAWNNNADGAGNPGWVLINPTQQLDYVSIQDNGGVNDGAKTGATPDSLTFEAGVTDVRIGRNLVNGTLYGRNFKVRIPQSRSVDNARLSTNATSAPVSSRFNYLEIDINQTGTVSSGTGFNFDLYYRGPVENSDLYDRLQTILYGSTFAASDVCEDYSPVAGTTSLTVTNTALLPLVNTSPGPSNVELWLTRGASTTKLVIGTDYEITASPTVTLLTGAGSAFNATAGTAAGDDIRVGRSAYQYPTGVAAVNGIDELTSGGTREGRGINIIGPLTYSDVSVFAGQEPIGITRSKVVYNGKRLTGNNAEFIMIVPNDFNASAGVNSYIRHSELLARKDGSVGGTDDLDINGNTYEFIGRDPSNPTTTDFGVRDYDPTDADTNSKFFIWLNQPVYASDEIADQEIIGSSNGDILSMHYYVQTPR